jgi:Ca-activated chloride channel family protein
MTKKYSDVFRKLVIWTLVAEIAFWAIVGLLYGSFEMAGANFQFLHPGFFWMLLFIPLILLAYLKRWQWKSELHDNYRGMGKTRMLWVTFHPLRYFLQYFFIRNILFFLVIALVQPVMGNRKVKGSKRVLDLVICLDVSSSMNTVDMDATSSRLTVAKRGVIQLLNSLKGERVSVVIFANEAYTQLPLTMDYDAAKMFVQEIETEMVTNQGTNIGAALEMAQIQFMDSESGHAVLVITDGEDHEQLWREQVTKIVEKDIELSYFGIGTEQGGLIPNDPKDPTLGYKRDGGGAVVSRLDVSGLKRMANATGSALHFTNSAYPDMSAVASDLSSVKSKIVKNMEFTVQRNYYQIPLAIAFCCFLGYLFVPFFVNRSRS